MIKKKLIILLIISILLLSSIGIVSSTNITTCSVLDSAGTTYTLNTTITDSNNSTCMTFNTNNIILDCQGHTIDGQDTAGTDGIFTRGRYNITIKNCIITDWDEGVTSNLLSAFNAVRSYLTNTTISSCGKAFYEYSVDAVSQWTISNVTIENNDNGIHFEGRYHDNHIINYSYIRNNTNYGLYYEDVDYGDTNSIYNNFFNNTLNVKGVPKWTPYSTWNITRQTGTRIYSPGTQIGGNYYTNSTGNGQSDTCTDTNYDGFCDDSYTVGANNIDYLVLSDEYLDIPHWYMNQSAIYITPTVSKFNITLEYDTNDIGVVLLESNYSGTPTNYTMTNDTYAGSIYNYTAIVDPGTRYWKVYANDTLNNFTTTPKWEFYLDGVAPTYDSSTNSSNTTTSGKPWNVTLQWNDNIGLDDGGRYIFSTNASGTWQNISATTKLQPSIEDADTDYLSSEHSQESNIYIKFNISNLPSNLHNITNVKLYLYKKIDYDYWGGLTSLDDKTVNITRIDNQTWMDNTSVTTYTDLLGMTVTDPSTASNGDVWESWYGWDYVNVTTGVEKDFNMNNENTSIRLTIVGYSSDSHDTARGNLNRMYLGCTGTDEREDCAVFRTREYGETAFRPYLNITYDAFNNFTSTPGYSSNETTLPSTVGTVVGWKFYARDNTGNWNTSEIFTLTTVNPIAWSTNQTSIVSEYNPTNTTDFNITWSYSGTNTDCVTIETNMTGAPANYTTTNTTFGGDIYNYSAIFPAGTFYWKSYANNTYNEWNTSDTWTFTISKNSTNPCMVNITKDDVNYTNRGVTILTSDNITIESYIFYSNSGSTILYVDGAQVSSPYANTFGEESHSVRSNTTGNQNYSANSTGILISISSIVPGGGPAGVPGGGGASEAIRIEVPALMITPQGSQPGQGIDIPFIDFGIKSVWSRSARTNVEIKSCQSQYFECEILDNTSILITLDLMKHNCGDNLRCSFSEPHANFTSIHGDVYSMPVKLSIIVLKRFVPIAIGLAGFYIIWIKARPRRKKVV